MKIEEQLGMRVRYLRSQKHLTIEEFSFECDLSKNYLCELENGKRNPSLEVLEKIAKALNMSISELTDGLTSF